MLPARMAKGVPGKWYRPHASCRNKDPPVGAAVDSVLTAQMNW